MTRRPPPDLVLAVARKITGTPGADWASSWARAATFLTRSALEDAVDLLWTGPLTPLTSCPRSTQLLCLPTYLNDPDLARKVHSTWAQLSNACHAHAYDLDPTISELNGWIDTVQKFIHALAGGAGPATVLTDRAAVEAL